MINTTDAYKAAIVADKRWTKVKALARIIDPDISYTGAAAYPDMLGDMQANASKVNQLYDEDLHSGDIYATFEKNRWVLDGTYGCYPTPIRLIPHKVGFIGGNISGDDCTFDTDPYATVTFSGVNNMTACGVAFSDRINDGFAVDFTIEVIAGVAIAYTATITGNTKPKRTITGFSVSNPTAVNVTVSKWSIPGRRARIIEIYAGGLEEWEGDNILDFDVMEETDLSNQSLPNGECKIEIYDEDDLYNPYTSSLYTALDERQSVDVSIGVVLPNATVEYVPMYKYYMRFDGWSQQDAATKISFDLTDLIGLVKDRSFAVPATLPTTISGWMEAVLGVLGAKLKYQYIIDSGITSALVASSADDVTDKKCGDILRWIAQASLGYMRCDKTTGKIRVSPWPTSTGATFDLNNQMDYAESSNRGGIAYFKFKYNKADGGGEYTINGTQGASDKDISVNNPFVRPNTIAQSIITNLQKCYDTSEITLKWRGRPDVELGDINTVNMWSGYSANAYLIQQNIALKDGVMSATSKLWMVKS